ncbi:Sec20-domain-containing protein [Phyllosticta citriasiana]|uniref:Sec20-domain-containing protein n=1 Tax=Phyllosticta citriasiana TaxID=595635 RepID=A0ABR1KRP5_9PEZI
MTTTQALATRLSSLSDQNKQTVQLIHRLAKLQFQPGSAPLEGDEGDVRIELSSEIHDSLKQQEEELELFRQEVEELIGSRVIRTGTNESEKEREKSRLSIQVARLGEDLKQARSQFRKAQLQAKRNAEAAKQKERELLFAGIQEGNTLPSAGRRRDANSKLTQDEIVAAASSDVTAALRRTHHLMTSELSRSRFAQETLDQSTAALAELGERYIDLNTLLSSSKTLVNTLLRSQKTDTWYLETTLYILLTTLVWLLYRRLLYGPTWWLIWLPLKLTYKLVFAVLAAVGLSGSAPNTTTAPAVFSLSASSSLIVKPSASNRPPPRQPGQQAHYIRAGAGGVGVKAGEPQAQEPYRPQHQQKEQDPSPDGSMSQQVGRMAEAAGAQQQQVQQGQGDDVPRRGDGQPLQQSDQPRNPKKRMMDVGEEQERMAREEAEQQQRQAAHAKGEGERKRDEL